MGLAKQRHVASPVMVIPETRHANIRVLIDVLR